MDGEKTVASFKSYISPNLSILKLCPRKSEFVKCFIDGTIINKFSFFNVLSSAPEPPRRERPDRGRLLPPLRRGQGARRQEGHRGGRVGLQGQDAAGHGRAVRVRAAGESRTDE